MKRGSMTKPLSKETRDILSRDIFMTRCCLEGIGDYCEGRIQFHHNLIYGGKRQDAWWSVLPLCEEHHRRESAYKQQLNTIMANRAPEDELRNFCKAVNYLALKHA
ncbi:MAG: hypothetical protein WAV09_00900 [Minisyncoccia bacterium]